VRPAAALLFLGVLGALTAFALPHSGGAANPKLIGTVNADYTITLKDSNGNVVTMVAPGTYEIEVHDNTAEHNFDLQQPNGTTAMATSVPAMGVVTWTVTLTEGTWTYLCDAHPFTMKGTFAVSGSTTTTTGATATTTTTTTTNTIATTTPGTTVPTTTTASVPLPIGPKVSLCRVPRVVGKPLSAARRLLAQRSCRTGRVARAYSKRVRRGRVVAQNRRPGARLAHGARVDLVVSRGGRG
jgi:hypothetical protein